MFFRYRWGATRRKTRGISSSVSLLMTRSVHVGSTQVSLGTHRTSSATWNTSLKQKETIKYISLWQTLNISHFSMFARLPSYHTTNVSDNFLFLFLLLPFLPLLFLPSFALPLVYPLIQTFSAAEIHKLAIYMLSASGGFRHQNTPHILTLNGEYTNTHTCKVLPEPKGP